MTEIYFLRLAHFCNLAMGYFAALAVSAKPDQTLVFVFTAEYGFIVYEQGDENCINIDEKWLFILFEIV